MEQEYYTSSLRDFLTVLFKHKLKILTVFAVVVTIVTARTFLHIPVYEAKSSLMVQLGREYIYRPEIGANEPTIRFNPDEVIKSEIQILTSPDLIKKVISNLGIENIYPELAKQPSINMSSIEQAVPRFKNQLSVEIVKGSNVMNLSFQHIDRQVPARVVNELVESFMERHLQLFSNPQSTFLEKQLFIHRQRLQESENNLTAFKQKNQIVSLGEQRSYLLKQRTELDTTLKTAQNSIHELQQKISSLTSQMKAVSENTPVADLTARSKNLDSAQANLLALQLKEEELASKYDENNPVLEQTRKQIQTVKDFIAELKESSTQSVTQSVTLGKNPVYQGMESELFKARSELSAQDAKCAALKEQLGRLDGEIQDLDSNASELRNLEHERDNNEKSYELYLTKLEEARISDELDRAMVASIKVIQKATDPTGPVPSRKALHIVVGIVLGAALGLALALFSEYIIEQGISSPEGVKKRLGLPVLASVPYSHIRDKKTWA